MPEMKLSQEKKAVQVGTLIMKEDRNLSFQGATPEIQQRFLELQKERKQKKPKGSVKNKFAEFVLRFAPDLVAND